MMAFGGIAALANASAVFVPIIGMVGGMAAMAFANHERLKLRIEGLETRLAQAEWSGGVNRAE